MFFHFLLLLSQKNTSKKIHPCPYQAPRTTFAEDNPSVKKYCSIPNLTIRSFRDSADISKLLDVEHPFRGGACRNP
jgi:hypothetical protein